MKIKVILLLASVLCGFDCSEPRDSRPRNYQTPSPGMAPDPDITPAPRGGTPGKNGRDGRFGWYKNSEGRGEFIQGEDGEDGKDAT